MMARTTEGRAFRILTMIDEYTRECLAILTQRRITSQDVIDQLFYLSIFRGTPGYIRSDNSPEFTSKAVRSWLNNLEVTTLFIEPGSPWENGYIESFNGKLRDELFNREIFTTLTEAKILIEEWRKEYNQVRPHSVLNYRPPAPETIVVDSNLTSGTINGGRSATHAREAKLTAYGSHSPFIIVAGMTYMYHGQQEVGLEIVRRNMDNLVRRQRRGWDLPTIIRCDTGEGVFGSNYFQNMILWALPAAMQGKDLTVVCAPGELVDRVMQAGR